jgi:Zn ribbon nucleic-acid-binding protein
MRRRRKRQGTKRVKYNKHHACTKKCYGCKGEAERKLYFFMSSVNLCDSCFGLAKNIQDIAEKERRKFYAYHICPKCHSSNISRFQWYGDDNLQYYTCWKCDWVWTLMQEEFYG